jgi:hypothetical protein
MAATASGFRIVFTGNLLGSDRFDALRIPVHWRVRFLVALSPSGDLFLCAKHLFVAAEVTSQGLGEVPSGHHNDRAKAGKWGVGGGAEKSATAKSRPPLEVAEVRCGSACKFSPRA